MVFQKLFFTRKLEFPALNSHAPTWELAKTRHTRGEAGIQCHGWQAVYVHVAWITAIPAGMTVSCRHLCITTKAGFWELAQARTERPTVQEVLFL